MNESARKNILSSSLIKNRSDTSKISFMKKTRFDDGGYVIGQRNLELICLPQL